MANDYKKKEYAESDAVKQAQAALQQQTAQKPGAYQSQWQTQLNDTLNKILNREKFSYDLNGDALYQQYKDQASNQGLQAMMDTMGQAAALTGGYGNSYAQSVGQQTYQGYLQGLNDKVPELYQLALSKYQTEGQDMLNQYGLLADQENMDYGRYRDTLSDYNAELDRLYNMYNAERDFDYGKYADDRDFGYGQYIDDRNYQYQVGRDQVSDNQWLQSFEYQQGRDTKSDEQWQAEFDEAKRQYDQAYALQNSKSSNNSPSSNPGTSYDYDTHGYTVDQIKQLQRNAGITVDGVWGPQTQAAWEAGYSADQEGPTGPTSGDVYEELLGVVSNAKGAYSNMDYTERRAAYNETVTAINEAFDQGLITAEQKQSLLRIATPGAR